MPEMEIDQREELIDRVWKQIEPSIDGYSKVIGLLLHWMTDDQIRYAAETLER